MKQLQKFLRLSRSDKKLLFQTYLLLGGITVGLRLFRFATFQQWLSNLAKQRATSLPEERPAAQQIVWTLHVASVWMPFATCLPQALAGHYLLTRHGYAASIQMGATRSSDGRIEAHAWVTSNQEIVIGQIRNLDRFTSFAPAERSG